MTTRAENARTRSKSNTVIAKDAKKIISYDETVKTGYTLSERDEKSHGNENSHQQEQRKEDENQCYLCCIKAADAIIIGCGHGGICHDCALISVKKKDQCMECREKVDGIYKINLNPVFSNIFKGYQFTKVVLNMSNCPH